MSRDRYAIIAGSGFAADTATAPARRVLTRFGAPSAPLRTLRIGGREVILLARHGETHDIPPHAINYRANLRALAMAGVTRVIGWNTVGVIRGPAAPGELAVPVQVIDYSWGRVHSFYAGRHANLDHADLTEPFAADLRSALVAAARAAGTACHDGGVYGVTQGPRLETAAEVDRCERDGCDYLGMTGMPEAALARELGIDYAMLCLVVNVAAGRGSQAIHADIGEHTANARARAFTVLETFFDGADDR